MVSTRLSVIGLALALAAGTAQAQSAGYIKEAVAAAVTQAQNASSYSGYGAATNSFCMLGGWIPKGKELQYSMTLEAGKGYLFVGAGDRDVGDLDLVVNDGANEVKDTETDNTPWVHVKAEGECTATISLQNFHGTDQGDFCVVIILEEGGSSGAGANLNAVTGQLASAIDALHFQTDHGTADEPAWCLMGGLFGTGGQLGIERGFAEGQYSVVGSGDAHCKDLDLEVQHEGQTICKDEDHDATPVGNMTVSGEARVSIHLKMFASDGNSFGIFAVLKH